MESIFVTENIDIDVVMTNNHVIKNLHVDRHDLITNLVIDVSSNSDTDYIYYILQKNTNVLLNSNDDIAERKYSRRSC